MELIGHHQQGEFRKGQKVTPRVQPPPRILVTDIHLGRARHEPLGRTLSQNDCLKTTRKQIPSPENPRLRATWQKQFSWVPLPYCSLPGHPFPIKSLALSAHVFPQTIQFLVLDKSPLSGPGRGSPSCNEMISCHNLLSLLSLSVSDSFFLFLSLSPHTHTHTHTNTHIYLCMYQYACVVCIHGCVVLVFFALLFCSHAVFMFSVIFISKE